MNEKRVTVFLNEDIKREIERIVSDDVLSKVRESLEEISGEKWETMYRRSCVDSSSSLWLTCGKFWIAINLDVRALLEL